MVKSPQAKHNKKPFGYFHSQLVVGEVSSNHVEPINFIHRTIFTHIFKYLPGLLSIFFPFGFPGYWLLDVNVIVLYRV